jgi:hypothetical protein
VVDAVRHGDSLVKIAIERVGAEAETFDADAAFAGK